MKALLGLAFLVAVAGCGGDDAPGTREDAGRSRRDAGARLLLLLRRAEPGPEHRELGVGARDDGRRVRPRAHGRPQDDARADGRRNGYLHGDELRRRDEGHAAVSVSKRGRSDGESASWPFTVATRTSDGCRSLRRGGRTGPATSSPGRSSQRRICAGET